MTFLWLILGFAAIAALIFITQKINRGKSSHCKNCKTKLSYPKDISVLAGPTKWVQKQKKDGTPYFVFYKNVGFEVKCSNCSEAYHFAKEIIIDRSDSNKSYPSRSEEIAILNKKIPLEFEKGVFEGEIEIDFIED